MTNLHKSSPLALTLRGYIQHAPERWRAHMAAAADRVEECARLREELDAERTRHEYTANVMRGEADRSDKADAEIARLREERASLLTNRENDQVCISGLRNDLAAARADAARCAYIRAVECNGDEARWNAVVDAALAGNDAT